MTCYTLVEKQSFDCLLRTKELVKRLAVWLIYLLNKSTRPTFGYHFLFRFKIQLFLRRKFVLIFLVKQLES